MKLPGRDVPWKAFFLDLYREIDADHVLDYAGSVAYSATLAVFPFLLFVVALASLVIHPASLETLLADIRAVAPPQVADILADRLHALTTGTSPGLLTISGVGAIWAAAGAVTALTTALNAVYDVEERRPFWKTRGLALLVTLAGAVLFIVASSLAIAAPAVAHWIGGALGTLVLWLRWPVAAAIMLLVVACLYYFLPDVDHRFRFLTPGSALAVAIWALASHGFTIYVAHFGRYEVVYGALGGVIVLLLWLWLSALVILLGAEINAVLDPSPRAAPRAAPPAVPAAAKREGA